MIVRLGAQPLATALGGRRVGGPAVVALPVMVPRWFGAAATCPVRRGPPRGDPPPALCLQADPAGPRLPVIDTPLDDAAIAARLDDWLQARLRITLAGTLLRIGDVGVLLRGEAGSGKSETALALLEAGHGLIADDAVTLHPGPQGTLIGSCPALLERRLCVRGLGLLEVDAHFGAAAWQPACPVSLVVDLAAGRAAGDLDGDWSRTGLLGRELDRLRLAPGRPLAALIAAAARQWRLRAQGNSGHAFAAQQTQALTLAATSAPTPSASACCRRQPEHA